MVLITDPVVILVSCVRGRPASENGTLPGMLIVPRFVVFTTPVVVVLHAVLVLATYWDVGVRCALHYRRVSSVSSGATHVWVRPQPHKGTSALVPLEGGSGPAGGEEAGSALLAAKAGAHPAPRKPCPNRHPYAHPTHISPPTPDPSNPQPPYPIPKAMLRNNTAVKV